MNSLQLRSDLFKSLIKQRKTHMKLPVKITAMAALMAGAAANGALLVHYTFDGSDATNSGTGPDGTVNGGSTVRIMSKSNQNFN